MKLPKKYKRELAPEEIECVSGGNFEHPWGLFPFNLVKIRQLMHALKRSEYRTIREETNDRR